jgi:hypothetical protein
MPWRRISYLGEADRGSTNQYNSRFRSAACGVMKISKDLPTEWTQLSHVVQIVALLKMSITTQFLAHRFGCATRLEQTMDARRRSLPRNSGAFRIY